MKQREFYSIGGGFDQSLEAARGESSLSKFAYSVSPGWWKKCWRKLKDRGVKEEQIHRMGCPSFAGKPFDYLMGFPLNSPQKYAERIDRRIFEESGGDTERTAICHSLGGIAVLHAERINDFDRIITLGSPHRSSDSSVKNIAKVASKLFGTAEPDIEPEDEIYENLSGDTELIALASEYDGLVPGEYGLVGKDIEGKYPNLRNYLVKGEGDITGEEGSRILKQEDITQEEIGHVQLVEYTPEILEAAGVDY